MIRPLPCTQLEAGQTHFKTSQRQFFDDFDQYYCNITGLIIIFYVFVIHFIFYILVAVLFCFFYSVCVRNFSI